MNNTPKNEQPKVECSPLEPRDFQFCNVCDPQERGPNPKLYEIKFHLFSFTQCMVVCDRHADELRQAVFCAQTGLK